MRNKRGIYQNPKVGSDRKINTKRQRKRKFRGGGSYLKGAMTFRQRMSPVYGTMPRHGNWSNTGFLSSSVPVLTQVEAREQKTLLMQSIQFSISGHHAR